MEVPGYTILKIIINLIENWKGLNTMFITFLRTYLCSFQTIKTYQGDQ